MAKQYAMRLNIYLDENEPKDKILIDYLDKTYSPVGFIKETIYALATGAAVQSAKMIQTNIIESSLNQEEFEPINADNIDL